MPNLLLKAKPVTGNSTSMTMLELFMETTEDEDASGKEALRDFAEEILEWGEIADTPGDVFDRGWRNVCAALGIVV